nr:tctex1 domain-containing protein 1-B-like [Halyomorpha halys]
MERYKDSLELQSLYLVLWKLEIIKMKLRNRHKLEPKNPFKPNQVHKLLEDIITEGVSQFYYNHEEAPQLCQDLASQIRTKIKSLNYDRCKLICVVDIVQKNLQGIRSICSFLWDPKRDHYATYSYNKFDLLATAYVFGIYHD